MDAARAHLPEGLCSGQIPSTSHQAGFWSPFSGRSLPSLAAAGGVGLPPAPPARPRHRTYYTRLKPGVRARYLARASAGFDRGFDRGGATPFSACADGRAGGARGFLTSGQLRRTEFWGCVRRGVPDLWRECPIHQSVSHLMYIFAQSTRSGKIECSRRRWNNHTCTKLDRRS
jgi:hypothetical protein